MIVLLDTHVWIWWLTGAAALPKRERAALDQAAASGGIRLSAISLWEAQLLHSRQRLELPLPFADWLRRATNPEFVTVLPLDLDVVLSLDRLPAAFHGDSADRLIVATARTHKLPLASHDRAIRRSRAVRVWTSRQGH